MDLEEELDQFFELAGTCDDHRDLDGCSDEFLIYFLSLSIVFDKPIVFDHLGVHLKERDVAMNTLPFRSHPFFAAAKEGRVDYAEKLLELGTEFHIVDEKNRTPLHYAAGGGHFGMILWLIEQGSDIYAVDDLGCNILHHLGLCKTGDGKTITQIAAYLLTYDLPFDMPDQAHQMTPLGFALINGWTDFAKLLIDKGVDLDRIDSEGFSYLHSAAFYGREELCDFFLEKEIPIDMPNNALETPLFLALNRGHVAVANKLLKRGAHTTTVNIHGRTTLHAALVGEQEEIAHLLIEQGADIHAKDAEGQTALIHAAYSGLEEFAFFLIKQGADIHVTTTEQVTLLHIASGCTMYNDVPTPSLDKLAYFLIEKGLDMHAETTKGVTPFHAAIYRNNLSLVTHYLKKGADPKRKTKTLETPLHIAAAEGHRVLCQLLIKAGAPIDEKNSRGCTPLLYASANKHPEIVLDLLEYDVELNDFPKEEGSPLFDAAGNGWLEVTQKLLEKGADASHTTLYDKTAYDLAKHYGHEEVAELLLSHTNERSF